MASYNFRYRVNVGRHLYPRAILVVTALLIYISKKSCFNESDKFLMYSYVSPYRTSEQTSERGCDSPLSSRHHECSRAIDVRALFYTLSKSIFIKSFTDILYILGLTCSLFHLWLLSLSPKHQPLLIKCILFRSSY